MKFFNRRKRGVQHSEWIKIEQGPLVPLVPPEAEPTDKAPADARGIRWLRPGDRCDRCGSQAYVTAIVNRVELHFCKHHFRKHEAKVRKVATLVIDER